MKEPVVFEIVQFLDIAVAEEEELRRQCEEFWKRDQLLFHRNAHGDEYAYTLFKTDPFPIKCPYEWWVAQPYINTVVKFIEKLYEMKKYPVLFVKERAHMSPDEIQRRAEEIKRNAEELSDKLLEMLLKLKPKTRKRIVEEIKKWEHVHQAFKELYGNEVLEIMGKARIEVKIVLKPKEAITLMRKYGNNWKNMLREILRLEGDL